MAPTLSHCPNSFTQNFVLQMYKNKYKILLKTKFYDILGPPSQTGFSNLLVYTHASTEGYLIDIYSNQKLRAIFLFFCKKKEKKIVNKWLFG